MAVKSNNYNRRDGVVVRTPASQSVDLGLNPLVESYQKTKKMVFTATLLGARHLEKVVENKLACCVHWQGT